MTKFRAYVIALYFITLTGCISPSSTISTRELYTLDRPYTVEEILTDFQKYSNKITPENIIYVLEKMYIFLDNNCPDNWDSFYFYIDRTLEVSRDFYIDDNKKYPLTIEESSFCRTLMKYHITTCSNRGLNPRGSMVYFNMLIDSLKIRFGKNTKAV